MKRFSKRSFSQIMINKSLKNELDLIKKILAKQKLALYPISYGDVILYLLNNQNGKYKIDKKLEFSIKSKLYVATPLEKNVLSVSSKLENKRFVSFL